MNQLHPNKLRRIFKLWPFEAIDLFSDEVVKEKDGDL